MSKYTRVGILPTKEFGYIYIKNNKNNLTLYSII